MRQNCFLRRCIARRKPLLFFLIAAAFFSMSCSSDHGVEPVRTKVSGDIIFTGPKPPDYVAEAVVVLVKRLPPENLLSEVIYSPPLAFNRDKTPLQDDTLHYELFADPGVYTAAGVLWRKSGAPWDIANILGVHLAPGEVFALQEVVVREDEPVADSVNIFANWEFANRDAIISGKIIYKDPWPANSQAVAVAAIGVIPPGGPAFLPTVLGNLKGLNFTLGLFKAEDEYRIAVNSGEVKFISLFWYGRGQFLDIRAVGLYHCGESQGQLVPKSVIAVKDSIITNVDFEVTFSSLPAGINYCKTCPPCP
ncbi:hypothetical protein EDS67_27330 [candidate division KSB1 bacterium]|nr:MAG: hypothetical protein EDS67_27330 [candidate division KSB1 bacterium]MCE7945624.1 hypothetical protein [Chlorobi bacterium CHB1]